MKKIILLLTLVSSLSESLAQSVGINTSTPNAAALLDIKPNGNHKSLTIPKIALTSKTDKSVINNSNPADGLVIYNSNPNVQGGKGIYFWNNDNQQWEFMVSQGNMDLFRNLTRYYTVETQNSLSVSTTASGANLYTIDSNNTGWTMVKDDSGTNNLTLSITVDQATNFLEINFTGTWMANTNSNSTSISRSYDVAYGIFVDGLLKYVRANTIEAKNPCNISNFYVNSVIPNITPGTYDVTFGVILRRVRNSGTSTTFPNNTSLSIGGTPNGSATTGCKSINAFESSTKATVFVNQTL